MYYVAIALRVLTSFVISLTVLPLDISSKEW